MGIRAALTKRNSLGTITRAVSVARRPRPDDTRVRIHIACGAVVVTLSAIRVGLLVRLHIGSRAGDMTLHRMTVRV